MRAVAGRGACGRRARPTATRGRTTTRWSPCARGGTVRSAATPLQAQLEADAARRPARWLWVYHWPPLGSPTCWTGKRHYGDAELGGWIARYAPDIVLTGHVHEPPFKPSGAWADRIGRTWVFNAGRQIGPVPAHIEIDLDGDAATWRSMLGVERLRLSGGLRRRRASCSDSARAPSVVRIRVARRAGSCPLALALGQLAQHRRHHIQPGTSAYCIFRSAR